MSEPNSERTLLARQRLNWGIGVEPIWPGLDVAMDIALERVGSSTRLAKVEGIDALAQDLKVAFLTAYGSDPFDTDFGFDGVNAMADESDPFILRERIRVAAIRVLKRDPRVRRVVDVRMDPEEQPEPRGPVRRLELLVQFETIAGESATVTLGRIAASE